MSIRVDIKVADIVFNHYGYDGKLHPAMVSLKKYWPEKQRKLPHIFL